MKMKLKEEIDNFIREKWLYKELTEQNRKLIEKDVRNIFLEHASLPSKKDVMETNFHQEIKFSVLFINNGIYIKSDNNFTKDLLESVIEK